MCNKDLIRREKKVSAITREKEILCVLGQKWNEKAPYFVRLHATMQVQWRTLQEDNTLKQKPVVGRQEPVFRVGGGE